MNADVAGVTLGILFANVVASACANTVAVARLPSWRPLLLPAIACAVLGGALQYAGYKLALIVIVPALVPCGTPARRLLALLVTPVALLALAGAVYAVGMSRFAGPLGALFPGVVESLLSAAAICATLLPFLPGRFLIAHRAPSRIAAMATLLLVLSGAYAQWQSNGVDVLGMRLAALVLGG